MVCRETEEAIVKLGGQNGPYRLEPGCMLHLVKAAIYGVGFLNIIKGGGVVLSPSHFQLT